METIINGGSLIKPKTGFLEDWFLQTSSDINAAVQAFVCQYEMRHQVSIYDYSVAKEMIVEGTYFTAGILRLNFYYLKPSNLQEYHSSAIIKVPHLGAYGVNGKYMLSYEKEKYIYEVVIPSMYESWPREKVVPDFYGATDSGVLMLENLRESGYYQKQNGSLFGFFACQVVLKSLAQFHALSIKHVDKMQGVLDSLTVVDRANDEWVKKVYPGVLRKVRQHVLPSCSLRTRKLFDEYVKHVHSVFAAGQLPNEGGFNVVLHGQSHCYNVLLKDDQRNIPKWCKLIDFQSSRRGSPILDIMMFLVTATKCEVVKKNQKALFQSYLSELENILTEIEYDEPLPYSLEQLYEDLEKYKLQFIYPVVCYVPIFWAGQSGELDLSTDEDAIDSVLKSDKYISFFRVWMKFLLLPKS